MPTNVLLTSAGRRNYLVEYFRTALGGRGEVYAADATAEAPALQESDRAFVVPPVFDERYIDCLIELCRTHGVRLLISLNDLELPILAAQRERFGAIGTIPVVSSPDVIDACLDKLSTLDVLRRSGLEGPKSYVSLEGARDALGRREVTFPLVVKPRWGTASIAIEYPEDDEELELAYRSVQRRLPKTILANVSGANPAGAVLVQERLQGQECGLDVINDLNGRYVTTFARVKLAMRAGETDRAVTVKSGELERLGRALGTQLGHVGNLDCDVFLRDGRGYVLEINPRFGGGYPFSHSAGANLPAALLAWADGEMPDSSWLQIEPDVAAAKCDRLVIVAKHRKSGSLLQAVPGPGGNEGARVCRLLQPVVRP